MILNPQNLNKFSMCFILYEPLNSSCTTSNNNYIEIIHWGRRVNLKLLSMP